MKTENNQVEQLNKTIETITNEMWNMVPKCSGTFNDRVEQLEHIAKTGKQAEAILALLKAKSILLG